MALLELTVNAFDWISGVSAASRTQRAMPFGNFSMPSQLRAWREFFGTENLQNQCRMMNSGPLACSVAITEVPNEKAPSVRSCIPHDAGQRTEGEPLTTLIERAKASSHTRRIEVIEALLNTLPELDIRAIHWRCDELLQQRRDPQHAAALIISQREYSPMHRKVRSPCQHLLTLSEDHTAAHIRQPTPNWMTMAGDTTSVYCTRTLHSPSCG